MRGLFLIVRRSLRQHALSSLVTALSVALAVGLLMAVFSLKTQTYAAFTGRQVGYDAVLGARGSRLQLVLNTVFHLETSPGTIPWSLYQQVKQKLLFTVPWVDFQHDLGKGVFSEKLRDAFVKQEIKLPDSVTIETKNEGKKWRITAEDEAYIVKKEDGTLNIYEDETLNIYGQNPLVELAVPYAVGDNYRGFRIVGTTEEIFTKFEYQQGRRFEIQATDPIGRFFNPKHHEAVIGSYVAQKTDLRVGDRINAYHGVVFDEDQKHPGWYLVTGILAPTNTPSDHVIWIPIEGIFRMKGHVLHGAGEKYKARPDQEIPDRHKELSAVMLKFYSQDDGFSLDKEISKQGKVATLAWPIGKVMADLFDKIDWVYRVLALVAYLVVVVAAASIMASIYNTMNERRREFAILRALGARRRTVFSAIVLEATVIAEVGTLLGFLVYAGFMIGAAALIRAQTGVVLDVLQPHAVLWLGPMGMIALGGLAGIVPAFKAYATDVATNLAPVS
ncbi:MAG: ABC transporter permease [Proteobacteria bacterium]|nr:ABC transporter permease [Pseudomonadota bacterium]